MRSLTKRDSPLGDESLFAFTILVVGLSGIVAQVMLLRGVGLYLLLDE